MKQHVYTIEYENPNDSLNPPSPSISVTAACISDALDVARKLIAKRVAVSAQYAHLVTEGEDYFITQISHRCALDSTE